MEAGRDIKIDGLNRPALTTEQAMSVLLSGRNLDGCVLDKGELAIYNDNCEELHIDPLQTQEDMDFASFNSLKSSEWLVPEGFLSLDVKGILLGKCTTSDQIKRVNEEYELYEHHNLVVVLRCLIYLISIFRENKYVWGVGRGSSVSSYCLYLLGVHKIDSIKYGLDIKEFLKDE